MSSSDSQLTPNQQRVLRLLREPGVDGMTIERIAQSFHWPLRLAQEAISGLDAAGHLKARARADKGWRAK